MEVLGVLVAIAFLVLIYKWFLTSLFGSKEQKKKADHEAENIIGAILAIPLLIIASIIGLFTSGRSQNEKTSNSGNDRSETQGSPDSEKASEPHTSKDDYQMYAQVLGLGKDHSIANIKRCYRERMMEYHPDRVAHLGPKFRDLAEFETKQINAAYDYFRTKFGFS